MFLANLIIIFDRKSDFITVSQIYEFQPSLQNTRGSFILCTVTLQHRTTQITIPIWFVQLFYFKNEVAFDSIPSRITLLHLNNANQFPNISTL